MVLKWSVVMVDPLETLIEIVFISFKDWYECLEKYTWSMVGISMIELLVSLICEWDVWRV